MIPRYGKGIQQHQNYRDQRSEDHKLFYKHLQQRDEEGK